MIKNLCTALYTDKNILQFNDDSGNAVFSCNERGIYYTDLNNINLGNNFDEDDPATLVLSDFLAWHIKLEKRKELKKKKSEELMTF